MGWYEDLERAEQERDAQEYECAMAFSDGYNKGRVDAIDEFINLVSESMLWDILAEIMKRNINASEGSDKIIEYLQKLAEQLKEQE